MITRLSLSCACVAVVLSLAACSGADSAEDDAQSVSSKVTGQRPLPPTPPTPPPPTPPGPGCPPPSCPPVMAPPPDFCEKGKVVEVRNASGCVTGFTCEPVVCPPEPMIPTADSCNGVIHAEKNADGCTIGWKCVLCPPVMAPPATYCEGGKSPSQIYNPDGCVSGWVCE